jgi:cytochrome c-type biogenesis protein CcmF
MTEAAIDAGLFRDLYVAMGEPVGREGAWAIRLHYKPMVRWMWLGALMMGIGGLVTVLGSALSPRAPECPHSGGRRCRPGLNCSCRLLLLVPWRCCFSAA